MANLAQEWESATPIKANAEWDKATPVSKEEWDSATPVKTSQNTPEWAGQYPNLYGVLGAGKEVARFGAESAALVGGGIAGMAAGGPVGAVAGAGLAYGGVKAAERYLEGEKATIPQAALRSAKDIGTGAVMEMGGQLVGNTLGRLFEKISKPQTSSLPASTVEERITAARKFGIELSPAEATGSKGLALYESMLEKSPFSTTIVNTWRELKQIKPLLEQREKLISSSNVSSNQVETLGVKIKDQVDKFLGQFKSLDEAQLNTLRDNVLKKMGTNETYETIGLTAKDQIAKRSQAFYDKSRELYAAVGETIPEGSIVNLTQTKELAARLLETEAKKPPAWQNKAIIAKLRDISGKNDALMAEIELYPEAARKQILAKMEAEGTGGFDWGTVQSLRSDLNASIASADAAIKTGTGVKFQSTPEAAVYKQLRQAMDKDIEVFSAEVGGDTKQAFDIANAFYKEGKQTYNAPALKRILAANPERVVDMVFRPKGGAEVDALVRAVGRDAFDNSVKPAIIKKLVDVGEVFDPKKFSANLEKYGDEVLAKVFSPAEIKTIKDLGTQGRVMLADTLPGHPFLKTIAAERPDLIVDSILGSSGKVGNQKILLRNLLLMRSVVDKPTMTALQSKLSDKIFNLNQLTGYVQPEALSKVIQSNEAVLKVMYSPEQVSWLKNIAETGKRMASAEALAKNPSGTAQNIITWGTWGAILKNPISGIATGVIAPKAMATFYLSDAGRRYFTLGMKTPIGSKEGVKLYYNIMQVLGVQGIQQTKRDNEGMMQ